MKCEFCFSEATKMMPQSDKHGINIAMHPCCEAHANGWWDSGADWDGCYSEAFALPYGINIQNKTISSDLHETFCVEVESTDSIVNCADEAGDASADAIEALLLALFCEGVNINTPQFAKAIKTAVETICNNLD